MLYELRVENLLLIERAELCFDAGLNVLTGETGAGKTVLARALDLLLGGKPPQGTVRPGAEEAYVEGVFAVPEAVAAEFGERFGCDGGEIVLARKVAVSGRTRAYVGGRSASLTDLRDIGAAVLSFYGQHEHRKLMLTSAQLEILDGFCGPKHLVAREEFGKAYVRAREVERQLEEIAERVGNRDREIDLLEWELNEIETVEPTVAEEADLLAQRTRLRHLDRLRGAVGAAIAVLAPEGSGGAVEGLAHGANSLLELSDVDAGVAALGERLNALSVEAQDIAGELGRCAEDFDSTPGQLDEIEERLALLERLKRKYGGTVEAVLAHAEACRKQREDLKRGEDDITELTKQLELVSAELTKQAAKLTATRKKARGELAEAVHQRLAQLAMADATFEVCLAPRNGFGPTGGDDVEFVIAANPGVAAAPLRESASGGELSRVMLALMSVAATSSPKTLVFDEIDAGIGGQTARAVGEQLRSLASKQQVICITHLPQVAAMSSRHFTIVKDTTQAPTRTTVTQLDSDGVVNEIVRMLGSPSTDITARRHAEELLKAT